MVATGIILFSHYTCNTVLFVQKLFIKGLLYYMPDFVLGTKVKNLGFLPAKLSV